VPGEHFAPTPLFSVSAGKEFLTEIFKALHPTLIALCHAVWNLPGSFPIDSDTILFLLLLIMLLKYHVILDFFRCDSLTRICMLSSIRPHKMTYQSCQPHFSASLLELKVICLQSSWIQLAKTYPTLFAVLIYICDVKVNKLLLLFMWTKKHCPFPTDEPIFTISEDCLILIFPLCHLRLL
jgi:hypothetical protein